MVKERSRLSLGLLPIAVLLLVYYFMPWVSGTVPPSKQMTVPKSDLRLSASGLELSMGWGTVHMKGQRLFVTEKLPVRWWNFLGLILPVATVVLGVLGHFGVTKPNDTASAVTAIGAIGMLVMLLVLAVDDGSVYAAGYKQQELAKLPADTPPERRLAVEQGLSLLLTAMGRIPTTPTWVAWTGLGAYALVTLTGVLGLLVPGARQPMLPAKPKPARRQ